MHICEHFAYNEFIIVALSCRGLLRFVQIIDNISCFIRALCRSIVSTIGLLILLVCLSAFNVFVAFIIFLFFTILPYFFC